MERKISYGIYLFFFFIALTVKYFVINFTSKSSLLLFYSPKKIFLSLTFFLHNAKNIFFHNHFNFKFSNDFKSNFQKLIRAGLRSTIEVNKWPTEFSWFFFIKFCTPSKKKLKKNFPGLQNEHEHPNTTFAIEILRRNKWYRANVSEWEKQKMRRGRERNFMRESNPVGKRWNKL